MLKRDFFVREGRIFEVSVKYLATSFISIIQNTL